MAGSNQHLDLEQYIWNIRVAAADDPALLDAWLHGRLDVDIGGACFGSSFGVRRILRDVRPGGSNPMDLKRALVCMDWDCSATTVAYLCLPDSVGGRAHLQLGSAPSAGSLRTRRRMLRHNAIEAWDKMLKTGWQRCATPLR